MLDAVKILVVDDEPLNSEMLAIMLEGIAQTVMAGNGREALDILAQNPDIDLILLDLEMPVMDGFKALEYLKSDHKWREIPVIVITASKSQVTRTLTLGANDFLGKPFDAEELRLRVMNHVRTKKLNDLNKDVNIILEKEVARKTAALQESLNFSRETEYEITLRLGRAAEFRDLETGMHTRRISEMSKLLGELATLSPEECEVIRYAAPLHDVGKVGIPDRILLKPGKLNETEFEIMKLHSIIGGKILADSRRYPVLDAGRIIALQHHEKWDGTGYPYGLSGDNIHIHARIVMIVDVFDALSSARPYKPTFPLEKSIPIMQEGKGKFFDPMLLELFLKDIENFKRVRESLQDQVASEQPMIDFTQYV